MFSAGKGDTQPLTVTTVSRWGGSMLRRTAASVVASVALINPSAAVAAPVPSHVLPVVADSAAETYRQARARILKRYREQTAEAQDALESAEDLQLAWEQYKRATKRARDEANADLKSARETFRQTVAQARGEV